MIDQPAGLVLALVGVVCIGGATEELTFRGIALVTFRRMGLTEGRVALYSSAAFGAVHLSNALGTGTTAIGQAIVVCFTGYPLYLTRRWAGAIWLTMPCIPRRTSCCSRARSGSTRTPLRYRCW